MNSSVIDRATLNASGTKSLKDKTSLVAKRRDRKRRYGSFDSHLLDCEDSEPKDMVDFIQKTSEVIKQEFIRMNRNSQFEDEVWLIESDKMRNFKDYFPLNNPSNLELLFNPCDPEDYGTLLSKTTLKSMRTF